MKLLIFDRVRLRLSLNYLAVISLMLLVFAVGVRILFDRILHQKIIDRLSVVAENAIDNVELDEDRLMFDRELTDRHRMNLSIPVLSPEDNLELFDFKGNQLSKLGKLDADLPLSFQNFQQVRSGDPRFQYVTLPLVENKTNRTVGYLRASHSLAAIDASLHKLDLGLIGGIGLTLLFSSGGAIWLTTQAMKPAEDSFQQLQQFTADASHELRSPLMAIVSNTRVALKYPAGIRAGDIDKFQSIESAAMQMRRLTEDLLWLARNNGNADRSPTEIVDLGKILADAIDSHQAIADLKQIKIKCNVVENLLVLGDELQLQRVLTNLIENAIFYNRIGGSIEIEIQRSRRSILVRIEDTGIGIATEHLPKIFDRFWRADTSRIQWEGGSGLGLAIVKDIITRHHGRIEVTSHKNLGSCFTIQLPISDLNNV
ncbi:HAMP domain-containing sensor histidine kinase [Chamaesiphon sp. GL140_3_metabinner_50]|uniref:sensor histidine kinase n=1 Tax=Chamaesiphon sp. GL140_3_metabinner_50 TaxID=2970812 RepID=UPI0025F98D0B|nr:HAMP domain-containing sensor histidine kinase [Chamaesiphon sp. GL140_3_metabinner_50]